MPHAADWSFEVPGTVGLALKRQRHEGPRLLPYPRTGASKVGDNESKGKGRNSIIRTFHYMRGKNTRKEGNSCCKWRGNVTF